MCGKTQLSCSVAVHLTIVEKQRLLRFDAEFLHTTAENLLIWLAAEFFIRHHIIVGIVFQFVAIALKEIADCGLKHDCIGIRKNVDAIVLLQLLQRPEAWQWNAYQELLEAIVDCLVAHLAGEMLAHLFAKLLWSDTTLFQLQEYAALLIHAEHLIGIWHTSFVIRFHASVAVDGNHHTAKVEQQILYF